MTILMIIWSFFEKVKIGIEDLGLLVFACMGGSFGRFRLRYRNWEGMLKEGKGDLLFLLRI